MPPALLSSAIATSAPSRALSAAVAQPPVMSSHSPILMGTGCARAGEASRVAAIRLAKRLCREVIGLPLLYGRAATKVRCRFGGASIEREMDSRLAGKVAVVTGAGTGSAGPVL